jgi:hypothetical protein
MALDDDPNVIADRTQRRDNAEPAQLFVSLFDIVRRVAAHLGRVRRADKCQHSQDQRKNRRAGPDPQSHALHGSPPFG